jgi:hypothetical protein
MLSAPIYQQLITYMLSATLWLLLMTYIRSATALRERIYRPRYVGINIALVEFPHTLIEPQ